MKELKKIGRTMAALRKKRGLTQEDLAGLSDVDRTYLSRLESGKLNVSILKFIQIAREIGEEPGTLLTKCLRKEEKCEAICSKCGEYLEYAGNGIWTCSKCSGYY